MTVPDSSLTVALAQNVDTAGTRADTLRQVAGAALAQYDSLAAAFRAYLDSDSLAHDTAARERAEYRKVIDKADTALAAMTQARDAWREAATCRTVFRIKCPTRTQVAVGASLVTLAAVWAVRR